MFASRRFVVFAALLVSFAWPSLASAQAVVIAGTGDGPETQFTVPFNPTGSGWTVDVDLIFDPGAPGVIKTFASPTFLIDALQPIVFPVNEFWGLPAGTVGLPVADWHEEILTPGWTWVLPGSTLYPVQLSLITRDGQPWPWVPTGPGISDTSINVAFPPIEPGHVLDIHKALLWVGTPDNRLWGDTPDEAGILVREYPTPEPSSLALAGMGATALAAWGWRRRRASRTASPRS